MARRYFLLVILLNSNQLALENKHVKDAGGEEARGEEVVMGITDVSLSRKSSFRRLHSSTQLAFL